MPINGKIICLWGHIPMCKNRSFVTKRGAILALVMAFTCSIVFGQNHFSGFAGIAGNMGADDDGKFQLTTDAFFAGQFDLLGVVLLRAEATVRTSNLVSSDVFDTVPASFTLDELSITARFPCCHATRYLSVFAGEYESIGSDLFLRRHFGILPIDSMITKTWAGRSDTSIYPFSTLGASYVLKLKTPQAFGFYFYTGKRNEQQRGNVDLRFAGIFPVVTVDFSVGVGFPITAGGSEGEKSLSLNRRTEFHTGLSSIIGNPHTASLFLQFGITKVILDPEENEKALRLSDLYFLLEPRFKADFMNFHFTLFNMPHQLTEDRFFITNPLGCNLAIFAENIYASIFNLTFGAHLTISAQGATLENFNDISTQDLSFRLTPFAETPIGNGTLMTRFTMDFMKFTEIHKSMKFTLGYKARL